MIKKSFLLVCCLHLIFISGCSKLSNEKENTYIFVQLTDPHLNSDPKHAAITEKLIEQINNHKEQSPINFIVVTGDLIDDACYDAALSYVTSIRQISSYPIYFVAGNNEFLKHGENDDEMIEKNARIWEENFGDFNYTVDIGRVCFVFVSLENLVYGVDFTGCDVFEWLENTLEQAKNSSKDVIIFTHKPIVKNFYKGKLSSPYPDAEFERLKTLVNKYQVNAIIAGHFHSDQLERVGNVPVYISPASVNVKCSAGRFRVYEYDTETNFLNYKTIEVW